MSPACLIFSGLPLVDSLSSLPFLEKQSCNPSVLYIRLLWPFPPGEMAMVISVRV
jgi:hypothetical protein